MLKIHQMDMFREGKFKRITRCSVFNLIKCHWRKLLKENMKISTNTKSLAKEFSKILILEYFGYLKIDFDVFFDADSESPRMTWAKMQP